MTYLDNASTTQTKFFAKDYYVFGNPNSSHGLGLKANEALDEARERIKKALGVKSGKVVIGGTVSQLTKYVAERIWGPIFGSVFEHDCLESLSNESFKNVEALEEKLNNCSQFEFKFPMTVACMKTNNITGTVYNTKAIGELCHKYGAHYIMDCTAAIGHNSLGEDIESYCDCLFASSHKFYGEIGTGFMWVSDRFVDFLELAKESHDEYGLISGTPDVSGAIAMSYALEHTVENFVDNVDKYSRLMARLVNSLTKSNIEFHIVDADKPRTNAINAITLPGINADALATFLSSRGIYIGVGHSACSDEADYRVLEAFGLSKKEASETVRISFCEDNTVEDVDAFVEGVKEFKKMFM